MEQLLWHNSSGKALSGRLGMASQATQLAVTEANLRNSELLRCFDRLDTYTWGEVLLPSLIRQGSARNVARACQRMRELVQNSLKSINLSLMVCYSNDDLVLRLATNLSQRFLGCQTMELWLGCYNSQGVVPHLLPALASHPALSHLNITVGGAVNQAEIASFFSTVRRHLPKLRGLTMTVLQVWAGYPEPWQQLALMTQLTQLKLKFAPKSGPGCCLQDVAFLSTLSRLQRLEITGNAFEGCDSLPSVVLGGAQHKQQQAGAKEEPARKQVQQQQGKESLSFIGHLTALTHLQMPVPLVRGLTSLESCRNLQGLILSTAQDSQPMPQGLILSTEEFSTLGQLTGLTQLCLDEGLLGPEGGSPAGGFCEAVSKLRWLRVLGGVHWSQHSMQMLEQLPKLEELQGSWVEGLGPADTGGSSCCCSSVERLTKACGDVPFKCFPKLQQLELADQLDVGAYGELAQASPKLQQLLVKAPHMGPDSGPGWVNLPDTIPLQQRVQAIQSLGVLPLTQLQFHTKDPEEIAAVLAMGRQSIRVLELSVPMSRGHGYWDRPPSYASVLGALGKLRTMEQLRQLRLFVSGGECTPADTQLLLGSLKGARVQLVSVFVREFAHYEMLREANAGQTRAVTPQQQLDIQRF